MLNPNLADPTSDQAAAAAPPLATMTTTLTQAANGRHVISVDGPLDDLPLMLRLVAGQLEVLATKIRQQQAAAGAAPKIETPGGPPRSPWGG